MKKAGLTVVGIVTVLAVIYMGISIYFQSHFCFGTTIDGIKVGGKTPEQVEKLIQHEIENYSIRLSGREGANEIISGKDIQIEPVFDGEAADLLEKQQGFYWAKYLFTGQALELKRVVSYDESSLEKELDKLSITDQSKQREPVNAGWEYKDENYVLVPADYGTVINKNTLKRMVGEAILVLADELDLDEANCYAAPEISDDNPKLLELLENLNRSLCMIFTYDFDESTEVIEKETIAGWLSASDDMEIQVNEEAVAEYVKALGKKYNTAYYPKTLETSYGSTVTIQNGHYGWWINSAEETAQLISDIKAGEDVTREPVYSLRANSHGENDYGDSYVEINLTAQHLFVYKDGKLVVESDFVSGCVAKNHATPTGAFAVTYKTKDAVLRGADYETPVNYWMPFNGDIGMHDLTSRRAFGGDIYLTNGSHGCINLPLSAAKTIYETIEQGWPVLVYQLPGTQSTSVMQSSANKVINAINAIGEVSLASETAITTARTMYDALDASTKTYVTNYDVLVSAETLLAQLKAETASPAVETPEVTETPGAAETPGVTETPGAAETPGVTENSGV